MSSGKFSSEMKRSRSDFPSWVTLPSSQRPKLCHPKPPLFKLVFSSKSFFKSGGGNWLSATQRFDTAIRDNFFEFFDVFSKHEPIPFDKKEYYYWGTNHCNIFSLTRYSRNSFHGELLESFQSDSKDFSYLCHMDHFHLHKGFSLTPYNFKNFASSKQFASFSNDFSKISERIRLEQEASSTGYSKNTFLSDPFIPDFLPKLYPPGLSIKNVTIRFYNRYYDAPFLNHNISYYQWSFIYYHHSSRINFGFSLFCNTQILSLIPFSLGTFLNSDLTQLIFKLFQILHFSFLPEEDFMFHNEFSIVQDLFFKLCFSKK